MMMKPLVISLFLAQLLHILLVGCDGRSIICKTIVETKFENRVINLEKSKHQNSTATVLPSLHTKTLEACKSACCSQMSQNSSCNVIAYKRNGFRLNCHLFSCIPLETCAFMDSPNMDTWIYQLENSSEHLQDPGGNETNVSTERKGAISENSTSLSEILQEIMEDPKPTKTATVVPRKGVSLNGSVLSLTNVTTTKSTVKSSVKPRKGVGLPSDRVNMDPKKNESFPEILPTALNKDATETTVIFDDVLATNITNVATNENMGSITGASKTYHSESTSHSAELTTVSNISEHLTTSSGNSELFLKESSITPSALGLNETTKSSTSELPNVSYNSSTSSPTTTSSQIAEILKKTSNAFEDVRATASNTISNATYAVHLNKTSATDSQIGNTTEVLFNTTDAETQSMVPQKSIKEEADEDALEAEGTAQIHLVIALTLGLVLLIVVLLVTARKMFDRWQRRHYRRMDYLIDGMYHN